jgi:hypothetical protein
MDLSNALQGTGRFHGPPLIWASTFLVEHGSMVRDTTAANADPDCELMQRMVPAISGSIRATNQIDIRFQTVAHPLYYRPGAWSGGDE